jgi:hypothetical protein
MAIFDGVSPAVSEHELLPIPHHGNPVATGSSSDIFYCLDKPVHDKFILSPTYTSSDSTDFSFDQSQYCIIPQPIRSIQIL